jgi:hypothetical protein
VMAKKLTKQQIQRFAVARLGADVRYSANSGHWYAGPRVVSKADLAAKAEAERQAWADGLAEKPAWLGEGG